MVESSYLTWTQLGFSHWERHQKPLLARIERELDLFALCHVTCLLSFFTNREFEINNFSQLQIMLKYWSNVYVFFLIGIFLNWVRVLACVLETIVSSLLHRAPIFFMKIILTRPYFYSPEQIPLLLSFVLKRDSILLHFFFSFPRDFHFQGRD